MKKFNLLVLSGFISTIAFSATALDLQQARTQGLVTEQNTGYIAAANSTPEVKKMVEEVNAARLKEYQRISKENGQPVEIVAKLAAEQIKKKISK